MPPKKLSADNIVSVRSVKKGGPVPMDTTTGRARLRGELSLYSHSHTIVIFQTIPSLALACGVRTCDQVGAILIAVLQAKAGP